MLSLALLFSILVILLVYALWTDSGKNTKYARKDPSQQVASAMTVNREVSAAK